MHITSSFTTAKINYPKSKCKWLFKKRKLLDFITQGVIEVLTNPNINEGVPEEGRNKPTHLNGDTQKIVLKIKDSKLRYTVTAKVTNETVNIILELKSHSEKEYPRETELFKIKTELIQEKIMEKFNTGIFIEK